jgi:hypothetical protein
MMPIIERDKILVVFGENAQTQDNSTDRSQDQQVSDRETHVSLLVKQWAQHGWPTRMQCPTGSHGRRRGSRRQTALREYQFTKCRVVAERPRRFGMDAELCGRALLGVRDFATNGRLLRVPDDLASTI